MKAAWSVFQCQCSWRSRSYLSLSGILYGALSSCTWNTSVHSRLPGNTCMLPGSCRWEEAMVCVSIHCCSYSVWSGICPLGAAQTEGFQIWLWHMHSGLFHYATHVMQGRVSGESILKTFWLLLNYCLLSRSHVLSICLLQAAELEDTAHMLQNRIHSDRLDQWLRKIGYS